jgi:small-conductance mechanosensitive channel
MESMMKELLFDPTMGRIVTSLVSIVVVVILVKIMNRALGRYVTSNDLRYQIKKIVTFLGYLLAIFVLSIIFSDKLSSLTVAFGVAGAGIAFALQEVIASIAGWAAMSFGRFYRTGDRVQLGGIIGDVIDIGILRTTLMECGAWIKADLYTGRIVRVANSFIFKEPVFNYSADFPFVWDEITMPVRYGSDYGSARKMFEEVLNEVTGHYAAESNAVWKTMTKQYLIEEARLEPMVTLVTHDNWAEYTLRYVVDYKKRRTTKDMICELLLKRIDETHGRIRLASSTFELTAAPELGIRILPHDGKTEGISSKNH